MILPFSTTVINKYLLPENPPTNILDPLKFEKNVIKSNLSPFLSPPTRKDLDDLSKWIDLMLEKISKEKKITYESVFEQIQLIYSSSIQEFIRQISIECAEKGQLLRKV